MYDLLVQPFAPDVALLIARLAIGICFIVHALGKLDSTARRHHCETLADLGTSRSGRVFDLPVLRRGRFDARV